MSLRAVAVIPARGGSRRIPRKNVVELAGKPLLAWTIEAALGSGVADRVVVDTDDEEIAAVARAHGAEVPFLRSPDLADAYTPTAQVTAATVERLRDEEGAEYDHVLQLLPTCPLRTADDVRRAYNRFLAAGADALLSCFDFGWASPWWALELDDDGRGRFLFPDALTQRSQDLPRLYGLSGAIWVARVGPLLRERTFVLPDRVHFALPWRSAIDVDEPEDLELAAAAFAARGAA